MTDREISDFDLEMGIIFCVCVANKTEAHARRVTDGLTARPVWESPLGCIRVLMENGQLEAKLRDLHSGQYTRLTRCLSALCTSGLDLRTCTPADLEAIPGIGPKTSRYFILATRPGARYAALDTHILKWLRSLGYDAPQGTPPAGPTYDRLEQAFLAEADRLGESPGDLDLRIWKQYAERPQPAYVQTSLFDL